MKKTLTLLLATLITLGSFAQKFDRAFKLQVGKYNTNLSKWNWNEPESVDLKFTIENNYVKIHDEYGTRIWTYEDLGEKIAYDGDGDKYKKHTWRAYDEKNRKCNFTMLYYTDIKLIFYTIQYSDIAFRYYISTDTEL